MQSFLLGIYLTMESLYHMVTLCLSLWGTVNCTTKYLNNLKLLPSMKAGYTSSNSRHVLWSTLLTVATLVDVTPYLTVVLISHFPKGQAREVDHLLKRLLYAFFGTYWKEPLRGGQNEEPKEDLAEPSTQILQKTHLISHGIAVCS